MKRFLLLFIMGLFCTPLLYAQQHVKPGKNKKPVHAAKPKSNTHKQTHKTPQNKPGPAQAAQHLKPNSGLLDSIIRAHPELKKVIDAKALYRPQIIYTQINRDENNAPQFTDHYYLVDSTNYFYCASLVKLPCSVFALEKINGLGIKNLTRTTTMLTDSAGPCQHRFWTDTSARNWNPSVEHHIKKMLLVSDNNSYSRIFEFLKPPYLLKRMTELGHPTARIVHRFDVPCIGLGNHYFNPIRFVDDNNHIIYYQAADSMKEEIKPVFEHLAIGSPIYNKKKKLISAGKDFTKSNYLSLPMIHNFLRDLVFNDYRPVNQRFLLQGNDWQFLMRHLGMYPRESEWPRYDSLAYYDSYKKYFIYGCVTPLISTDTLRIFNIVGRAYGFSIDCAYIVDFRSNTEFLLSAVIYTNKRNSFGAGIYEYDQVGLPYLRELSLALYDLEKMRLRKREPDLKNVDLFRKQQ